MIRISSLLRNSLVPSVMEAVRGPKKKKGDNEAKIQSTDIINIFKDRSDPVITDIRQYPIYVQQQSCGNHTFHEFQLGIQHNLPFYMPYRSNYNGYLKAMKRQRVKSLNLWRHIDAKPDIFHQNHDLNHRRALYAVGSLSKEQAEEKMKAEEAAAAAEDDDEE